MNKKFFLLSVNIVFFSFLLSFYSCNKYSRYSKWILGEWVSDNGLSGYYFISKDTCEFRPGYIDPEFDRLPRKYFGNRTLYQLSHDTLRIFDLSNNSWEVYKISFPTPTTMILLVNSGKNSYQIEYEKAKYSISSENLFDQVVISNRSFRKFKALSLDSSGIFLYSGCGFQDNDIKGLYVSNNGKYAYKQIELLFKEANSKNVFLHTFPARIDSIFNRLVPTITFIKNNRMATIAGPVWNTDVILKEYDQDYFSKEFIWAYDQSTYLEQQVSILPFIKPDYWSHSRDYIEFSGYSIPALYFRDNNKRILSLFYSEEFYLWTQILKAKQVDADFTPAYTVNDHIQSDGRYYRYKTERGDTITLDLGFNFIEVNNLADKFEK